MINAEILPAFSLISTTSTTTEPFIRAALFAMSEGRLMPPVVCFSFEVADEFLEQPTLRLYMPEGFRSIGGSCGYAEANTTFFPECSGEMPVPASEISCQERFDKQQLRYYLHFEASGDANSSSGFAFQFQVKAPRTNPEQNTWSLTLSAQTQKAAWTGSWFLRRQTGEKEREKERETLLQSPNNNKQWGGGPLPEGSRTPLMPCRRDRDRGRWPEGHDVTPKVLKRARHRTSMRPSGLTGSDGRQKLCTAAEAYGQNHVAGFMVEDRCAGLRACAVARTEAESETTHGAEAAAHTRGTYCRPMWSPSIQMRVPECASATKRRHGDINATGFRACRELYRYGDFPNIGVYGTSCAPWDFVPGTPHYGFPAALFAIKRIWIPLSRHARKLL